MKLFQASKKFLKALSSNCLLRKDFLSFSGASCFSALFNLQGARRFVSGLLYYHTARPLSTPFFNSFLSQGCGPRRGNLRSPLRPQGFPASLPPFASRPLSRALAYSSRLFPPCQHLFSNSFKKFSSPPEALEKRRLRPGENCANLIIT